MLSFLKARVKPPKMCPSARQVFHLFLSNAGPFELCIFIVKLVSFFLTSEGLAKNAEILITLLHAGTTIYV
jgi:hypothetical protein